MKDEKRTSIKRKNDTGLGGYRFFVYDRISRILCVFIEGELKYDPVMIIKMRY